MNGCCLVAILMGISPRLILFFGWLFSDPNWYNAFDNKWTAFLCWLILPWTSLAYIWTYFNNGGQITGMYIGLLIAGLVLDLGNLALGKRNKDGS